MNKAIVSATVFGVLWIGFLLFGLGLAPDIEPEFEPKFKVYEEVCHNESVFAGWNKSDISQQYWWDDTTIKPHGQYTKHIEQDEFIKINRVTYNWDCSDFKTIEKDGYTKKVRLNKAECSKKETENFSIEYEPYHEEHLKEMYFRNPTNKKAKMEYLIVRYSKKKENKTVCEWKETNRRVTNDTLTIEKLNKSCKKENSRLYRCGKHTIEVIK